MQAKAGRAVHEMQERVPPVLTNRGFALLWVAQIVAQTAQNAILYALIIRVLELTGSAASTSVVVFTFVVPTVAFGVFSGILVDRWSKRRLLIITNAGRCLCAVAFVFGRDYIWALYGITMVLASFSQLFTTSSAASVPFMVSRRQLVAANSLFSGAFTIAQLAGLIVLSPAILKAGGAGTLFASAAGAFLIAALLSWLLPFIGHDGEDEAHSTFPGREELRGALSEFGKALSIVRSDTQSALAMVHITTSSTLILLFAVLVPRYMQAILDVPPDNAVAVFAPVAIGALVGLRAVPIIVGRMGKTRTVALGLLGIAICLGGIGFVETIAGLLERTDRLNPFGTERVFGLSILVALTMLFAGPLGFAYAMLNAPAQTTLHERTPIEMRGRVIASQMVLANGVALIPLVVMGGIADLYGVSGVILAIALLLGAGGAVSLWLEQRWGDADQPPATGGDRQEWSRPNERVNLN